MKKLLLLLLFLMIGCTTKYIKAPLSSPPKEYIPKKVQTENDFLLEYRNSLIKIKEWQSWYNIQAGSNYF